MNTSKTTIAGERTQDQVTHVSAEEYDNVTAKFQAKARAAEIIRLEAKLVALRGKLLPYIAKEIHGAFQAAANGISTEEARDRAATQIKNIEKAAVMI